jgi:hypothetical protein
VRRLLRRRQVARQSLQEGLHAVRRTLELFEVFLAQTIEPQCPGRVAKFVGHRLLSLIFLHLIERTNCGSTALGQELQKSSAAG